MDSSIPDWSSLPQDLLAIIGNHLLHGQSLVDLLRFRAVCHSFRSSAPSPPNPSSPLFSIIFTDPSILGSGKTFSLTESTVYAINPLEATSHTHESTPTWLLRLEHSNMGKVRIRDPCLGYRFKNLPDKLPKSFNLLDYRVKELTKAYRLETGNTYKKLPTYFDKVVISTDGLDLMAIDRRGKVFLLMNGADKLINIELNKCPFMDLVYYKKKFYAVDFIGVTIVVDSKSSLSIARVAEPVWDYCYFRWNLVKSFEDLFIIVTTCNEWVNRKNYLKVYRFDEEKLEWVPVRDELEDRVLFVTVDWSFSLSTRELCGFKGNSVHFLGRFHGHGKNSEHVYLKDEDGIFRPGLDDPDYSKLLWPPPTWLKPDSTEDLPSPPRPYRRPRHS